MKKLILLLSVAVPALAVYTYTTIDTLTSANSTTWQANGSPTYSGNGLNSSSAASLISKITTPGNANQYEVTAKLNLTANDGSRCHLNPPSISVCIFIGSVTSVLKDTLSSEGK